MRYLGGKTQIAKHMLPTIAPYLKGRFLVDAFCGSLAVTLAAGAPTHCVDVHPALISMYRALQAGWDPPNTLTREEWEAAKRLPDSDPLKAFAGFGCSFRGLYFSGYAGGYVGPVSNHGAQAAAAVLRLDFQRLRGREVEFHCASFLDLPIVEGALLYCDPPYLGTTGYAGTPPFDYTAFVRRVQEWAEVGPVLVSEYQFPVGRVVWEKDRAKKLAVTGERAVEKLFLIGAP